MENLQPGQMLGPYRIINQIGQGGMAAVYKAYQASMDRNVAVKVLPRQLAESGEFAKRFQQEARIIANLEHPHILPVFDYGESDGVAYFVMRYLEAGTLKDRMQAGSPLPLNEIDRIFTQLADALGYAHSRGVVHRDLKPANALVDSDGNLFLTDFGIAKLLENASPRLTQTDAIMGTPAYISPEQAQAQPVDRRSDIYSLGIILYEMVTGRVPFVADTPLAVILKQISDPLPPPSSIKEDVSPAIERVILKALSKDPQDRFSTAAEFLSAWKSVIGEKEPARLPRETISASASRAEKTSAAAGSPRSKRVPGLIVGCLAVGCIVVTVAVVIGVALNWQSLPFVTGVTNVPLPTMTITAPLPIETVPLSGGGVLLEDDFTASRSAWGILKDNPNGSIEYLGDALHMLVFTQNWIVWSTPNDKVYENIHLEVTVINNGTDSTTAFGFRCNQQADEDSFYYFAVTPGGEYVIARAETGKNDFFLTNNDQWGESNLIERDAGSYRIGADCSNGALTLYVNGQRIDSASDSSYARGGVALFTWSGEEAKKTDVSFDDFVMTELK